MSMALLEMTISAHCRGSGMHEKSNSSSNDNIDDDDYDDDNDNINSTHSVQSSSIEECKKYGKSNRGSGGGGGKDINTHSGTVSHESKCVTVYSSTQKIESETKSTE